MTNEAVSDTSFGVVVIGRNEGERLKNCLNSVSKYANKLVYVDSGSEDDSVNMALAMGVKVVGLDMRTPFTAARARNEGFENLIEISPQIKYVQFVDGDCEIVAGWLQSAVNFLEQNKNFAVVCGRRRERCPDRSIYNRLCDMEWNTPIGEVKACGGDAMMRVTAFQQVEGFRADFIAGEEPELCVRFREQGWKIWRLDAEMTLHDAAILRFGQWWRRSVRTGFSFAEGAYLHGNSTEKHWVKETRSAWVWGMIIPLITVILLYLTGIWALFLLVIYPIQVARLTFKGNYGFEDNLLSAFFIVAGKFPEMTGAIKSFVNRVFKSRSRLIEYK